MKSIFMLMHLASPKKSLRVAITNERQRVLMKPCDSAHSSPGSQTEGEKGRCGGQGEGRWQLLTWPPVS